MVVLVAGCASAGMQRQPMQVVDVAGSTFRVYMKSGSNLVEVHRVSPEALPSRFLTLANAERAIEIATGCGLKDGSLRGDQAIVVAKVDCELP